MKQSISPRRDLSEQAEMNFLWSSRRQEKTRERRRKPGILKRFLVVILLIGTITLTVSGMTQDGKLYGFLHRSDFFRLRRILIFGNQAFSGEEVLKIAEVKTDENLWDFPVREASLKLKSYPRFRRVFVSRIPPKWALIFVEERKLMALLNLGNIYGVDGDGRILPLGKREHGVSLPLITGLMFLPPASSGEFLNRQIIEKCREVFQAASFLIKEISEINFSDPQNTVLYGNNGVRIVLGEGAYERKIHSLRAVWEKFSQREKPPRNIDLRWNGQVVVQ